MVSVSYMSQNLLLPWTPARGFGKAIATSTPGQDFEIYLTEFSLPLMTFEKIRKKEIERIKKEYYFQATENN